MYFHHLISYLSICLLAVVRIGDFMILWITFDSIFLILKDTPKRLWNIFDRLFYYYIDLI